MKPDPWKDADDIEVAFSLLQALGYTLGKSPDGPLDMIEPVHRACRRLIARARPNTGRTK